MDYIIFTIYFNEKKLKRKKITLNLFILFSFLYRKN